MTHRPLCDIAREVKATWPKVNYAAAPYLDAMESLDQIDGYFYAESADMIVRYFLTNTGTWRGEDARRIKAELREIIK